MPADNLGYVKIWRELFSSDWKFYGDTNTTFLFITLFVLANYQDGHWKGNKIKRGQLITGRKKLSEKTGLSIQQVRTSLDKLKSTSKITIKTTNKFSLITVNNYDKHQKSTSKITNNQPTNNQQITTNKKNKKNKKKRKIYKKKNSFNGKKKVNTDTVGTKATDEQYKQFLEERKRGEWS